MMLPENAKWWVTVGMGKHTHSALMLGRKYVPCTHAEFETQIRAHFVLSLSLTQDESDSMVTCVLWISHTFYCTLFLVACTLCICSWVLCICSFKWTHTRLQPLDRIHPLIFARSLYVWHAHSMLSHCVHFFADSDQRSITQCPPIYIAAIIRSYVPSSWPIRRNYIAISFRCWCLERFYVCKSEAVLMD